jgi:uncharacterized protein
MDSSEASHGSARKRIASLDILRGIALFLMIGVHVGARASRGSAMGQLVGNWIDWYWHSKGHAIFSILFGASFAVMFAGSTAGTRAVGPPFVRRVLGLLAFGVVAEGVFDYPVLIEYAVTGVALFFVRNWSTRALLILALLGPTYFVLHETAAASYQVATMGFDEANAAYRAPRPAMPAAELARAKEERAAIRGTSFLKSAAAQLTHLWRGLATLTFTHSPMWHFDFGTLQLLILGLLGVRLRIFEQPERHRRIITIGMLFGLACWIVWRLDMVLAVLTALRGALQSIHLPDRVIDAAVQTTAFEMFGLGWFLALTYVGTFLLLVSYSKSWERRLEWVASAGRLGLTNYMAQVVIISVCFSAWGIGWTGLRMEYSPAVTLLLFACLVMFSRTWSVWFRYGPAEWVLRSVTYWRLQPVWRAESGTGRPNELRVLVARSRDKTLGWTKCWHGRCEWGFY